MNKSILMGRLTADPELKSTESGIPVTSFCLAVDRAGKGTDFIDCIAWRKSAEFICRYMGKGQRVAVIGHLQARIWEDKQGTKRKATEVVVESAYFADGKKEDMQPVEVETPFESGMDFASEDPDLPF